MWSKQYKGYFIQGNFGKPECVVLYSPTGYGYKWKKICKNERSAKLAITKHIREEN